ncbi:hypothetical protein [Micromonospora sp. RV43]|uniref:hypothetical protein n=1 Tax=Micromonospora sp. RV43 TaxID=1661387 RepID=UPI00064C3DAC|nr:hypothetical protein [Micromonospora sp. RV43]
MGAADRPRRRLGKLLAAAGRLIDGQADRQPTDPVAPVGAVDRADRPPVDRPNRGDRPTRQPTDRTDRPPGPGPTPADGRPTGRRSAPPRPARPKQEATRRKDRSPTQLGTGARIGLVVVAVLMAVVVAAPVALSAQDLIDWAASPTGLGLDRFWAAAVFIALDAAAAVCVLLMVYCAVRGEPAGAFGLFVWVFAGTSAFANYRHGSRVGAPDDAWWFFPLMSILGPALMELVLRRVRTWVQRDDNRRSRTLPSYGWRRWMPGIGSFRDTFGACRTAILLGIDTVDLSIDWYHYLCPDGSLRIVRAMRKLDITAEQLPREVDPSSPDELGRLLPPPGVERVDDSTDRGGHRYPWPTDPSTARDADRLNVDRRADRRTDEPTDRRTDRPDEPAPTDPRPTAAPSNSGPTPTDHPSTDRPTTTNRASTDRTDSTADGQSGKAVHNTASIQNAAILRTRYGREVPPLATVRGDLKWSYERAKNAIAAYKDRADVASDSAAEPAPAGA